VALKEEEKPPTYALEGSVFIAGAIVQWLRDGLQILSTSSEIENLAKTVEDTEGVVFVPALVGLGAPYWRSSARGAIFGITRGTTRAHIARAALEGVAMSVTDLIEAIRSDKKDSVRELRVDGGASQNNLLMQMQADYAQIPILRPKNLETTALGVCFLAGMKAGIWRKEDIGRLNALDRVFYPQMKKEEVKKKRKVWKMAVKKA
jgi:glycerol kinase